MVNITHKISTLRKAIASAVVSTSKLETIQAVQQNLVPKGNVFEFSRAAGLLAVKKTSDVIPDCHPLPVEYTAITHRIEGLNIIINVEVHAIYRTGVEVEAMHGAAITALTIYDMLKPIDKSVEIGAIRLESKKGGKSDQTGLSNLSLRCAVVVCSDTISAGTKHDSSGKAIVERLEKFGMAVESYVVIPDDFATIQSTAIQHAADDYNLVVYTGGTGLSPRDVTPQAIEPLITNAIPGIMETARQYGQQRMPFAMLSRGVAGFINNTLVITMPGSMKGVEETMDALFPHVFHVFKVMEGGQH